MKLILRNDIRGLGRQGEVREAAPGYARNYLIPRGLAMEATPGNLKLWEKEKVKYEKQRLEHVQEAKGLAEKIEKVSLTITVKTGDSGKLFGSVTNATIAKALEQQGFKIDKHDIMLGEPLKEVGVYTIDIRLHTDVAAKAKVWIVAEKSKTEPEEEAKEEAIEETKEQTEEK